LAGVLYLINLMQRLDLPSCFEQDWGLASQVGAWGTLEVLGRALLGSEAADRAEDPLWRVLAALDGREDRKLPGEGFCGGPRFRLPPVWQAEAASGGQDPWLWATNGQRLRLWNSQGYMPVDCPGPTRESAAEKRAREKLQPYLASGDSIELHSADFQNAPLQDLSGTLVARLNPDLNRWLVLVLPYLQFRLEQFLRPGGEGAFDLEKTMLRFHGRLFVTSTHLDLVLSLEEISLPVRMAGLDRDPGWLVDFGRVVQFHFE
jgi:hypothetical protein